MAFSVTMHIGAYVSTCACMMYCLSILCTCISLPLLYKGLLQEVPELYLDSSGSSSYHFIHKTVQEFMAALYVSSLPPDKRAELIMTPNMTMVAPFTAGLTKLQSQDDMESFITFQREGGDLLVETLHWLFEAHDPDLVLKCMGDGEQELILNEAILDPFDCYVLGYCFANSGQPRDFRVFNCTMSGECMKMLAEVENGRAFDYMKVIDFYGNGMGDQGAMEIGEPHSTGLQLEATTWGNQNSNYLAWGSNFVASVPMPSHKCLYYIVQNWKNWTYLVWVGEWRHCSGLGDTSALAKYKLLHCNSISIYMYDYCRLA